MLKSWTKEIHTILNEEPLYCKNSVCYISFCVFPMDCLIPMEPNWKDYLNDFTCIKNDGQKQTFLEDSQLQNYCGALATMVRTKITTCIILFQQWLYPLLFIFYVHGFESSLHACITKTCWDYTGKKVEYYYGWRDSHEQWSWKSLQECKRCYVSFTSLIWVFFVFVGYVVV